MIAWTTVSVFGFVYLYLCRTYVQWNFTFPPIPDGLPTLLGVSAGTTVAAMGITVNHGSKGAGPVHPSMADFISTGGINNNFFGTQGFSLRRDVVLHPKRV